MIRLVSLWFLLLVVQFGCKSKDSELKETPAPAPAPVQKTLEETTPEGNAVRIYDTSVFSLRPPTLSTMEYDSPDREAFTEITKEQIPYFMETMTSDDRIKRFVPGDMASVKSDSTLDYFSTLTNFAGFKSKPEDLHRDNASMVTTLQESVNRDPESYGLPAHAAGNIVNFTDLPYEFYADHLIRSNSVWAGRAGGAFSAFAFQLLSTFVSSARAWGVAVIASLGAEPTFAAAFVHGNLRQLYFLHRYYSYVRGAKYYSEAMGMEWDPKKFIFDPKLVVIDHHFKARTNQAWLMGFIAGSLIKAGVSRPSVEKMVRTLARLSLDRYIRGAIKRKNSKLATRQEPGQVNILRSVWNKVSPKTKARSKVIANPGNGKLKLYQKAFVPLLRMITSPSWGHFVRHIFTPPGRTPRGQAKQVKISERTSDIKRIISRYTKGIDKSVPWHSKIYNPASLAFSSADYFLTSTTISQSIYFLTHLTGSIMSETQLSPGDLIEYSLISNQAFNSEFVEATRKFVYPFCLHFIRNAKYMNAKVTSYEVIDRTIACRKLIMKLEGLRHEGDLRQWNESLADILDSDEPYSLTKDQINLSISHAAQYPYSYRVTWLAFLRAMFPLNFVPAQYFTLQYRLLLQPDATSISLDQGVNNLTLWESMTGSLQSSRQLGQTMNIERLNFAIEYMARKIAMKRHNNAVRHGTLDDTPITELKDERIERQTTDLVDSVIAYTVQRKLKAISNLAKVVEVANKVNGLADTWVADDFEHSFMNTMRAEGLTLQALTDKLGFANHDWKKETMRPIDDLIKSL